MLGEDGLLSHTHLLLRDISHGKGMKIDKYARYCGLKSVSAMDV